jgi:hypothetical protein
MNCLQRLMWVAVFYLLHLIIFWKQLLLVCLIIFQGYSVSLTGSLAVRISTILWWDSYDVLYVSFIGSSTWFYIYWKYSQKCGNSYSMDLEINVLLWKVKVWLIYVFLTLFFLLWWDVFYAVTFLTLNDWIVFWLTFWDT